MEINISKNFLDKKEDISLIHTKEIIAAIKNKVKDFNLTSEKKVNYEQLRMVFLEGATNLVENKKILDCGFARINMFLRLISADSFAKEFKKNISLSPKSIKSKNVFNFSDYLSPLENDFIKASEDLKSYKLNFEVQDINNLYFVDSKWVSSFIEFI